MQFKNLSENMPAEQAYSKKIRKFYDMENHDNFKKYLESKGVLQYLSRFMAKLKGMKERPENPLKLLTDGKLAETSTKIHELTEENRSLKYENEQLLNEIQSLKHEMMTMQNNMTNSKRRNKSDKNNANNSGDRNKISYDNNNNNKVWYRRNYYRKNST